MIDSHATTRLEIGDHSLTWEEHSQGARTIVFIHGWSMCQVTWNHTVARLFPIGRCVTLDLPGHYPAQSPEGLEDMILDDWLEIGAAAIEVIGGGRPVTIIGHSMGGLMALGIAARYPELVEAVVSAAGLVWGPPHGAVGWLQRLLKLRMYPAYHAVQRSSVASPGMILTSWRQAVHKPGQLRRNNVARAAARNGYRTMRHHDPRRLAECLLLTDKHCDLRPWLRDLDIPVLAMTGSHDNHILPEQSRWLANHLRHAELVVLDKVGHLPQLEAPAEFEAHVLDWLERCS